MRKKNDTVRYTAEQIKSKIAQGEDRTNWDKVDAVTGARLEESIRADPDDIRAEPDWTQAIAGIPAPKDHINIRIDHDVLEWFRSNGKGYQTLMNNVLRAFVQTRRQRGNMKSKSSRSASNGTQ
jgi:uncharacterized protein (DUF4415 family)